MCRMRGERCIVIFFNIKVKLKTDISSVFTMMIV